MYHEETAAFQKPRYGTIQDDERLSAEEMDERRRQNIAYEYLCHLEEAKRWIEACLEEDLPPTTELEEGLRNGVYLGKLATFFAPKMVSEKRIYDRDQTRYKSNGLHFRHTDNTVQWLRAMESVGLPKIFYPETTDVYDRKNMPKVVYCIHALSLYLYKLGIAPQIQDLLGKVDFTEEEISNMRSELEKYGIQMPAFSKIGGILANELSVDEAALHAAVIAINEAINKGQASVTMAALHNPNAMLRNIKDSLAQEYQDTLSQAKGRKQHQSSRRKSTLSTEERDVYEELLTQQEIQSCIDFVNVQTAIMQVNQAVSDQDEVALLAALRLEDLALLGVQEAYCHWYLEHFTTYCQHKTKDSGKPLMVDKEEIQRVVSSCNDFAEAEKRKLQAVAAINTAIRLGNPEDTVQELMNPEAQLPIVYQPAANLYQNELFSLQLQGGRSGLSHEELSVAVEMLSAVAVLNEVLDTKDPQAVIEQLTDSPLGFTNMDQDNVHRYADTLITLRAEALASGQEFLTWNDVQKCIDAVNIQVHEEHERIIAIAEINEALNSGDHQQTLEALLLPTARLTGVDPAIAKHYHDVLLYNKQLLCERCGDESAVLWLDQIQEAIDAANQDAEEAFIFAGALADINRSVAEGDPQKTLRALQSPGAGLKAVLSECADTYQSELSDRQDEKAAEGGSHGVWVKHCVRDRYDYYFNLETGQGLWQQPEEFDPNTVQLDKDEIQGVVSCVTVDYNREQLWLANEGFIIQLQARVRGFLARKKHAQRMEYLREQEPHVVKLQACWKGYKQRKAYKERMNLLQDNVDSIVKLQSWVKMWKAKRQYNQRLRYFKEHEKEIVKIQAFLKANKAREDYRTLTGAKDPPLSVVRKFVHLLEQSPLDVQEEQEVTRLREEVVTKIRSNQQMEKDLNLMDIKIGLLVKNRITLQDVVTHNKKMKNMKNKERKDELAGADRLGIKGLNKVKRRKLEAYQHLFYLLQTNPSYLAKLIFQMPQNKSTKFMDTVIFTLYNYASNQREEYLLLKLFKTALEEEINSKVDQMQDIVTGNPTVIKMVVSFNRGARGHNTLRQLLAPVVKDLIEDKNLGINTNPVDVYKAWVNQVETATGEASKLPYEVTPEQAMSHEEVRNRLEASSVALRAATDKVLNSIVSSLDNIPYGMKYIAKVLKNCLHEKFPDASDDELMKIVGNLLYYRYMNPAIVAPDGFDIIDMSAGGQLHSDQRRNLGSVAKMLQHAAANKLFEGENAHLTPLNNYISQTYDKFREFFQAACDVPEPEEKFNIDEYSDMVTLSKPIIYISIEEIINTHSLLLEHLDAISPDRNDLLHELLQDLGDVPDVETLLGEGAVNPNDPNRETALSLLAKTEISLTLTSKFELLEGDDKDLKTLMTKTKKLIVDVVRIQPAETLTEILESPASAPQELEHNKIVARRAVQDAQTPEGLKSSPAVLEDSQLPIEQKKRKIQRNLRNLEQASLVSAGNNYQDIINDVSKDIRYQRRYRQRRKAELVKLQQTLTALNSKTAFFQEQMNYYDTYIKTCLDNLNRKNSRRSIKLDSKGEGKGSKKSKPQSLKYTAARLHEKGVILEIEGLQTNQFKNVMFDISPTEEVGDFEVKAKFMGVEMEKVQLHFQDLLQMQYEGVAVMKMFDKAKVNVNLLIFLLNKKFHGK
ncbi:ras GTPase-activating-like protein IQGAP2 [Synchiropus splendidus]|uniref:ras GTPase-activating-like protein IQGAP2 n=1 Tax=Synchiropus splendidus TaxID=270530 RepID=UPI00237D8A62|nr:ras GTPase-activating-like protein IQGAP2 [Synchiropus splendidus]XP_053726355.1 ras GTPase-activating-like protein IQGAP2 [Synchiropus splendidus]